MKRFQSICLVMVFLWIATVCSGAGNVVMTVSGDGPFSNDASLMLDGNFVDEQTLWDDPACVNWLVTDTVFTVDMGDLYRINNVTIQLDHNDDYLLEYSENGEAYLPLMTVKANEERVAYGMKTVSSDASHGNFLDGTGFKAVNARYVRLKATRGDGAYAVGEIQIYRGIPAKTEEPAKDESLKAESSGAALMKITGFGEFNGDASLMVDGVTVDNETTWDDTRCVNWTVIDTYFVIDLGELYLIKAITLDADHNDTYTIEISADGQEYMPLFTLKAAAGHVETGMERISTDTLDPDYLKDSAFQPVMGQYLKIRALEGDDAYSIAEIGVRKTKN